MCIRDSHISHLFQILVCEIKKLLLRHPMPFAGNGDMELGFLYPAVACTIVYEMVSQFFGCRPTESPGEPEIQDLDKPGYTFRDFPFIVTDSVEVRAAGQYGCYHTLVDRFD